MILLLNTVMHALTRSHTLQYDLTTGADRSLKSGNKEEMVPSSRRLWFIRSRFVHYFTNAFIQWIAMLCCAVSYVCCFIVLIKFQFFHESLVCAQKIRFYNTIIKSTVCHFVRMTRYTDSFHLNFMITQQTHNTVLSLKTLIIIINNNY